MAVVTHKLGEHIEDLVVMSRVLSGVSMVCGSCKKGCVIELPHAQFTTQSDLQGKTFWCPYCGTEGHVEHPGRIVDIRPYSED